MADRDKPPLISLIRAGAVWAPEPVDATDILVADGRIAALGRNLEPPRGWPVEIVDARDRIATPALIDQHAHITGGGGEGGPGSRCPVLDAGDIASQGIATVVGVLGTDCVSRSPADLLARARDLRADGISAYLYTGAYRVPPPTLTGDIQRDLAWIPEVLGVGEIALSDHRSGQPTLDEIARLVSEARVGGMLAGKRGICHFHLGDGQRGLDLLRRLLSETEIPPDQVIPTHVNRRHELLEEAGEYARMFGAPVDVTAFDDCPGDAEFSAYNAVRTLLDAHVPLDRITLSSDCNGSLPTFDAQGDYAGMRVARNTELLGAWRKLVRDAVLPIDQALALVTTNVARVLGLQARKGRLAPGFDADVVLFDGDYDVRATYARGRRVYRA